MTLEVNLSMANERPFSRSVIVRMADHPPRGKLGASSLAHAPVGAGACQQVVQCESTAIDLAFSGEKRLKALAGRLPDLEQVRRRR